MKFSTKQGLKRSIYAAFFASAFAASGAATVVLGDEGITIEKPKSKPAPYAQVVEAPKKNESILKPLPVITIDLPKLFFAGAALAATAAAGVAAGLTVLGTKQARRAQGHFRG